MMTNPIGRPTKYNDEMQAKAERYAFEWQEIGDVIPSRVGLCCWLSICKQTSYEWEIHPQFLDTLRTIDTLQEYIALNKGVTGEFNSNLTKLILSNHGYSDKQQTDITSSGQSLLPNKIERVIIDAGKLSTETLREIAHLDDC